MKAPWHLSLLLLASAPAFAQDTLIVSQAPGGSNNHSNEASISADGRFVVFTSRASNLVPGDTNGASDVFLRDRQSGALELISRNAGGTPGDNISHSPTISANGRFVAFVTRSSDIGLGRGIYLLDRQADVMHAASVDHLGNSREGTDPRISPDGRYVVFSCSALVPGDVNGSALDVYRFDRVTGRVAWVSVDAAGVQSGATAWNPSVSAGGRYVAFDTFSAFWDTGFRSQRHVWVKDMQTGALTPVSKTQSGEPGNNVSSFADLSADGTRIAFQTVASNLVTIAGAQQIAFKDLVTGEVSQVTVSDGGAAGNNYSYEPRVSGDGRFVAFRSTASNLHLGGSSSYYSIYVRDQVLGQVRQASMTSAANGQQPVVGESEIGGISLTGRYVALASIAEDLVANDGNGVRDVFVRDRFDGTPYGYGWSTAHTSGCVPHIDSSGTPSASAGSGFVVTLADVRSQLPGMLIYSTSGPATTPLFGSTLYLRAPIKRTNVQVSAGTPGGSCDGSFETDVNALVGAPNHGGLVVGARVWAQYWSRDNAAPGGAHFSDALAFELGL